MNMRTVLFGERAAGVYLLTEIYDPDIDGADVSASGKIVPAVGSQIVDNTKGLHNQLYTVVAVDQTTYKATLTPSTYVVDSTAQVDRVLSYGNDIFMLYFSPATITIGKDKVTVNRLIVDNKLSLFGNHAATYQLTITNSDGEEYIISRWYDATGVAKGSAIPMLETGVEGVRKCDGCYTDTELNEGDVVTCRIYSAAGIMIAQIELIAKPAHFLHESISSANPIVGLEVVSNQMLPDGTLYLYQGQNIEELAIFTKLHYSNGTIREIAVDNRKSFVYGLEEIRPDVVEMEYDLTVKYYLSNTDVTSEEAYVYELTTDTTVQPDVVYYTRTALDNTWQYSPVVTSVGAEIPKNRYYVRTLVEFSDEIGADGNVRFIARRTKVRIVSTPNTQISKISVLPVWSASGWTLSFAKYFENRQPNEGIDYPVEIVSGFAGNNYGVKQEVVIRTFETVFGIKTERRQTVFLEVRDRNKPESVTERKINWLIADTEDDVNVYGDAEPPNLRPRIKYEGDENGGNYSIPSNVFTASSHQSASEVFLDNFYFRANPPKLGNEATPPTPTHFTVKTTTGRALMQNRRSVEDFTGNLGLDVTIGNANQYVGGTLVIEFFRVDENTGVVETLYGVPVDVVN